MAATAWVNAPPPEAVAGRGMGLAGRPLMA